MTAFFLCLATFFFSLLLFALAARAGLRAQRLRFASSLALSLPARRSFVVSATGAAAGYVLVCVLAAGRVAARRRHTASGVTHRLNRLLWPARLSRGPVLGLGARRRRVREGGWGAARGVSFVRLPDRCAGGRRDRHRRGGAALHRRRAAGRGARILMLGRRRGSRRRGERETAHEYGERNSRPLPGEERGCACAVAHQSAPAALPRT
jgi:hypothetical protein